MPILTKKIDEQRIRPKNTVLITKISQKLTSIEAVHQISGLHCT